jgi:hypothetical protein
MTHGHWDISYHAVFLPCLLLAVGDAEEVSICINPSTNKYHVALNNKMLSIPEMPSDICEIVRFITSYSKTIYE